MGKASGVRGVTRNGNGWMAQCTVRGKHKNGPVRNTIEEAARDYNALKREQDQGKVERKQATSVAYDAQRAAHADHLNTNWETQGGNQAKDALGRELVKMVMAEHETLGVADGVEYSIDQHLFYKQESYDFDPKFDAELDDRVPTLALELKVSQSLQPNHGTYDNPLISFYSIHYADQDATLVLMIYVPKEYTEANADALDNAVFWFERAKNFRPARGTKWYCLHTSKSQRPLRDLPKMLSTEIDCHTLVPYGHRSRQFKYEKHRIGQVAIDAFEDQVLRSIGAKLMPVEGEGGAEDRILVHYDGRKEKIQVKKVFLHDGQLFAHLHRANGSIRLPNGKRKTLKRPYSIHDNVDAFVFVALKEDESLLEYWYADVCAMLGDGPADRLITDRDGVRGVQALVLYPWEDDAIKYGLRNPESWYETDLKERTQAWIRDLGGIMPLSLAQQLKEEQREERDEERAERKRQRLI